MCAYGHVHFVMERFHSRGHHLCRFIGTKESVCVRKESNSHRISLGHQHGRRFIVLGHQYGRRYVMWKHSIGLFSFFAPLGSAAMPQCCGLVRTLQVSIEHWQQWGQLGLGIDHLTFKRGYGWFQRKISCRLIVREKNVARNTWQKKKIPTLKI